MPTYIVKCGRCGFTTEIIHSITDTSEKKCTRCKRGVFIKQPCVPIVMVKAEPREAQQVGEENWNKLGKYGQDKFLHDREQAKITRRKQVEEKLSKVPKAKGLAYKQKPAKPWWRDTEKPMDISKIKDPIKYIQTGEK